MTSAIFAYGARGAELQEPAGVLNVSTTTTTCGGSRVGEEPQEPGLTMGAMEEVSAILNELDARPDPAQNPEALLAPQDLLHHNQIGHES